MSREIKFRAWWPGVKQMRYFNPGDFEDTRNGYAMTFIQPGEDKNIFLGKAEIMQFTGYHDKTGMEIYENDITKAAQTNERYQVIWMAAGWKLMSLDKNDRRINSFQPVLHQTVIGNIYEQTH